MTDHRHAFALSPGHVFAYCDVCDEWPVSILGSGKRTTMPSRQFLISQAVLNAVNAERGHGRPLSLDAAYLWGRSDGGRSIPIEFAEMIRAHFRALVAQYGGTTCPPV